MNESPPVFSSNSYTVTSLAENVVIGTHLSISPVLSATDNDPSATLVYSLSGMTYNLPVALLYPFVTISVHKIFVT